MVDEILAVGIVFSSDGPLHVNAGSSKYWRLHYKSDYRAARTENGRTRYPCYLLPEGQERSFRPQDNIPVPELIAYLEIHKLQFLPGLFPDLFSGRLSS